MTLIWFFNDREPGFRGQSYINTVTEKVRRLKQLITKENLM